MTSDAQSPPRGAARRRVRRAVRCARVVAFTGMHSMNGVRDDSDNLAKRHLRAAELLGESRSAPRTTSPAAQHLYVHDGDLKTQDGIAEDFADNVGHQRGRRGQDREAARRHAAPRRSTPSTPKRGDALHRHAEARDRALAQGDGHNVEERDGSRALFTGEVLKADDAFEQAGDELTAEADQLAAGAVDEAAATASSGSRFIIVIALLAIAAAAALAVWVTRSVVRPVRALGERMTTLDEQDLSELSVALGKVADGDLTYGVTPVTTPIEVTSTDELGRLSTTFNGMLDKARHSIESYGTMRPS